MTALAYVHDDGGRQAAGYQGTAGDCVVRAVAIATQQDYATVYAALSDGMRAQRQTRGRHAASARNGVSVKRKWFRDYMHSIGWRWVPTMGIGTGCRVHLVRDELPSGRLIVSLSKHYTAVIEGVIHDTFNPTERGTTIYPPNTSERIPTGAIWLDNGNGWAYCPDRCVYGYWQPLASE